jgi:hypothetical protein
MPKPFLTTDKMLDLMRKLSLVPKHLESRPNEPTEKMLEAKRMLMSLPVSKRKEILDKGMALHKQRQKVAELKKEREELLKKV